MAAENPTKVPVYKCDYFHHNETILLMKKAEAGIRELKTHLSRFLRRVQSGEAITITDRGTPVARMVPIGEPTEVRMQALQQAGIISWSGNRLQPREPVGDVLANDKTVSDLLLEDRR